MDTEIIQLIDQLIQHGAEAGELNFWRQLLLDLKAEEKTELLENLQSQLAILTASV